MCGRFSQSSSAQDYAELFALDSEISFPPRYNVSPNSDILACRVSLEGNKELVPLHWGLVPSWSKGLGKRFSMINARAETVATKPAYRAPFRRHRCLIPVDGFFEWHEENGKQPYYIKHLHDSPIVFAGLWDHWDDGEGDRIESCSIITCEASPFMLPIHERMPVILKAEKFDDWLESKDTDYLQTLLVPYAGSDLEMYPVSPAMNNPKHDSAELLNRLW